MVPSNARITKFSTSKTSPPDSSTTNDENPSAAICPTSRARRCKRTGRNVLRFLRKWINSTAMLMSGANPVANAAPNMPHPNPNMNNASSAMFPKLPTSMATMASCGLPSLRTNGSSTLFNKNSGANAKMVRRYVTVSGSVASSAPKSDANGVANASTTASSTAAATPAMTSAVVNTRFAPVRSPLAEHTWNSVAAPMPSMRPVACSTVYSTMEKLSAARPSDPTPFAMKNVSASMYTDTPTMPSTLNDTYRANGRAIDDEPAMPAPRAIARRLTPRARCRMPRCARCRTPRLSRGRCPCCARPQP